ncbi:MAG: ATPase, partial [Desulfobulbaceae bacterium]|nr:ATPase [Desulfobulbaceae bacterium]
DGATGLGLPYVRQIIQEHRGDITITSTQGQGTSVKLTLPSHLSEFRRSR